MATALVDGGLVTRTDGFMVFNMDTNCILEGCSFVDMSAALNAHLSCDVSITQSLNPLFFGQNTPAHGQCRTTPFFQKRGYEVQNGLL